MQRQRHCASCNCCFGNQHVDLIDPNHLQRSRAREENCGGKRGWRRAGSGIAMRIWSVENCAQRVRQIGERQLYNGSVGKAPIEEPHSGSENLKDRSRGRRIRRRIQGSILIQDRKRLDTTVANINTEDSRPYLSGKGRNAGLHTRPGDADIRRGAADLLRNDEIDLGVLRIQNGSRNAANCKRRVAQLSGNQPVRIELVLKAYRWAKITPEKRGECPRGCGREAEISAACQARRRGEALRHCTEVQHKRKLRAAR